MRGGTAEIKATNHKQWKAMGEAVKLKHKAYCRICLFISSLTKLLCCHVFHSWKEAVVSKQQSFLHLYLPEVRIKHPKYTLKNESSPTTTLIRPAEVNLHKGGYFTFEGWGYSCSFPAGEGLHTPNSSGLLLLQLVWSFPSKATGLQKGHCGIQLGSDMAATNPATDTTLPNVRLAENFNDFSICTDMHFTVLLNCFTWAVYRISQFLKYPQIWSITSKSLSVVHWALQMLLLTMATEHAHHRKSWSQPPFS